MKKANSPHRKFTRQSCRNNRWGFFMTMVSVLLQARFNAKIWSAVSAIPGAVFGGGIITLEEFIMVHLRVMETRKTNRMSTVKHLKK